MCPLQQYTQQKYGFRIQDHHHKWGSGQSVSLHLFYQDLAELEVFSLLYAM